MKFIKPFSIFETERVEVPDETRDLFSIWTYLEVRGPIVINMDQRYMEILDWERGEVLDEPDDHVKTYSTEAQDDNGITWSATIDVVDEYLDGDIDKSSIEIMDGESFFTDQIKKAFADKGFRLIPENQFETRMKTDAQWEEVVDIFPELVEYSGNGKKGEFLMNGELLNPLYTVRFDLRDISKKHICYYLFMMLENGKGIWSSI